MASSNLIHKTYLVEKLSSTNYNLWSVKIEMILVLNIFISVVNAIELNRGSANLVLQNAWKIKDAKARADIILQCGD